MTQAIKSHGTLLKMGDGSLSAGGAKTFTDSEVGDPWTILNASVAHGFHDGQVVTISGVTGAGATVLNAVWPVEVINTKSVAVKCVTTGVGGGTILLTPSAEQFTTVGEVKDITGPGLDRATFDVTTHDSPNDYDEFMIGVKSSGEVAFAINWNPSLATHDASVGLKKAFDDGTLKHWQLFNTANDHLDFSAYVTGFAPKFPVSGVVEADIKLKVTGDVVLVLH